MCRADPVKPLRVAYIIGTFAGHPVTVAAMNRFLKWVTSSEAAAEYSAFHTRVGEWVIETNALFTKENLPLRVTSYASVWTMLYQLPSRYHWMLQYYLRDEGITLSWVGTGRLNFSHDFNEEKLEQTRQAMIRACRRMREDGWWVPKEMIASELKVKLSIVTDFARALIKQLWS